MRSFAVTGANRETGKPVRVTIEANTLLEAQDHAADMGIMVSDVQEKTMSMVVERPPERPTRRVQPEGQERPSTQVIVQAPSAGSSSLGVASMVLGVVALLLCWIPFIAYVSLLLGGVGLLLAIIGGLLAVFRRGRGVGFAIGGGTLCAIAVTIGSVMSIGLTGLVVAAPAALEQARAGARDARAQTAAASPPAAPAAQSTPSALGAVDPESSAPTGPTVVEWQAWADVDDVRIRLVEAYVGTRDFDQFGRAMTTTNDAVWIKLEIANPSSTKRATFVSWRDRGLFGRAEVVDEHGNRYVVYSLTAGVPEGGIAAEAIYPNQAVVDWIACELPVDAATELRVRPLQNGRPMGVEFRLPDEALSAR